MTRYPIGITLPEQQRRQLFGTARSGTQLVRSHTCDVTMPDGTTCAVTYARFNGLSHQLDYGPPISQRVWVMRRINEGVAGVEEAAAQHAAEAFRKAQEAEQKEMRRKTPPPGEAKSSTDDAALDRAKADRFAGQYAVCLRFASGRLLRIGHSYDRPEEAQEELQAGQYSFENTDAQRLVIGICNRWARCWQEARLLAAPPAPAVTDTQPAAEPTEAEAKPRRPRRSRRAAAAKAAKAEEAPPQSQTPDIEPAPGDEPASEASKPADPAFTQWMSEVEEILLEHTGMTTADLRHGRYRDWFEAGYTPEEAVREALGTNGYDDNLDEPFRRE